MATPRKTRAQAEAEAEGIFVEKTEPAIQADVFDDELPDDVTDITNALAEIGEDDGAFVSVYKYKLDNGRRSREYIDRFPAFEFSLNSLKDIWGAGSYLISLYEAGGQRLIKRRKISIASSPKADQASHRSDPVQDLTPLITAMQDGFKAMLGAIAQSQPKQQSRMEMLEEMKLMRDTLAPVATPSAVTPVQQVMDAMKLGMEMAAMNAGGDSNNQWAMKAMEMFGKPIVDAVLAGNIQPQPANGQQPGGLSSPATPALPGNPQPQPVEEDSAVNLMLKGYIQLLSNAAEKNEPVEDYANSILDMVPNSQIGEVEALLRSAEWQSKLAAAAPAVNKYPVWFGNLRGLLLEFIDQDKAEMASAVLPEKKDGNAP